MPTKKKTNRVELTARVPDGDSGTRVITVPTEAAIVGPVLGDADNKYATRGLVRVTKQNIAHLAGLAPHVAGLEPIDGKTVGENGTLTFRTAPDDWPREIGEQDA